MGQIIRTPLPVFTSGTVAGNASSAVVTGTNTAWMTLDANNNSVPAVSGGDLFITPTQAIPIRSVDSATQLTLECPLSQTMNAGSIYRIVKVQPNLTGGVQAAIAALMALGTDATPDQARTIDSGAGRIKVRIAANGDPQLAVGPAGTADAALAVALDISPGGVVAFPNGIAGANQRGRNLLINGNFAINQRGYGSGVSLASLSFGHDRWKAWNATTSYTFSQGNIDTPITITTGQLGQIVEDGTYIKGVNYTLSWTGTSQVIVQYNSQGSGQSIVIPSLTTGFTTKTFLLPADCSNLAIIVQTGTGFCNIQLEVGSIATTFERRFSAIEMVLCQRYFIRVGGSLYHKFGMGCAASSTQAVILLLGQCVTLRTTPTLFIVGSFLLFNGSTSISVSSLNVDQSDTTQTSINAFASGLTTNNTYIFSSQNDATAHIDLSAEI